MSDIDVSVLDFILILIITYGSGVASGLCFCTKYRNVFLSRSGSVDNFKEINIPEISVPIIQASAPPPPPSRSRV